MFTRLTVPLGTGAEPLKGVGSPREGHWVLCVSLEGLQCWSSHPPQVAFWEERIASSGLPQSGDSSGHPERQDQPEPVGGGPRRPSGPSGWPQAQQSLRLSWWTEGGLPGVHSLHLFNTCWPPTNDSLPPSATTQKALGDTATAAQRG